MVAHEGDAARSTSRAASTCALHDARERDNDHTDWIAIHQRFKQRRMAEKVALRKTARNRAMAKAWLAHHSAGAAKGPHSARAQEMNVDDLALALGVGSARGARALARAVGVGARRQRGKRTVVALGDAVARALEQAGHTALRARLERGRLRSTTASADALCTSGLPDLSVAPQLIKECARVVRNGGSVIVATAAGIVGRGPERHVLDGDVHARRARRHHAAAVARHGADERPRPSLMLRSFGLGGVEAAGAAAGAAIDEVRAAIDADWRLARGALELLAGGWRDQVTAAAAIALSARAAIR